MSFNNVEQMALDYLTSTLAPWRRRWKEAVHRHLLTPVEQRAGLLYAEHNVEAMLRGDFKTQTEGFRSMLSVGVYSINEVRRWLNMNPVADGDEHYVQLNMASIAEHAAAIQDLAGQGGNNNDQPEGDEDNGNR
jgi:phage portal protein BeeE